MQDVRARSRIPNRLLARPMTENLQFRNTANRAATVRSGNDLTHFKRLFRGMVAPMYVSDL
jgi:hypothetical protein